MKSILSIRQSSPKDIDDIMRLEQSGFDQGILESREAFAGRIAAFPEGILLLAKYGETIGYISSEIWAYKPYPTERDFAFDHDTINKHNTDGTELYISSIVISPDHRSHGYGQLLFHETISHVSRLKPSVNSCLLIVNETWQHAYQIYLNQGFREISRLNEFFEPLPGCLQTAIVMRRSIS
jgi:[ribosomal protein S18]-alanine N-acetyltransferase